MERKLLLWIWWWPTFPPHQLVLLLALLKLCCCYPHQLSGKHRTPLTRSYQNLGEQCTSSSRARNFWFLATKSVSQFSSTRAAVPPFTLTPSRPWMRQEVVNCIYILDFFGCHGWWGLAPVRCFDPEALKPLPNLEPEWKWLSICVKMRITQYTCACSASHFSAASPSLPFSPRAWTQETIPEEYQRSGVSGNLFTNWKRVARFFPQLGKLGLKQGGGGRQETRWWGLVMQVEPSGKPPATKSHRWEHLKSEGQTSALIGGIYGISASFWILYSTMNVSHSRPFEMVSAFKSLSASTQSSQFKSIL